MVLYKLGYYYVNPEHITSITPGSNQNIRMQTVHMSDGTSLDIYESGGSAWADLHYLIGEAEYVKPD